MNPLTHEDATMTVELLPKSSVGEFRLDDFLEQMNAIKSALRETERFMSGAEPSLYLRINSINKNSPIRTELEAMPEHEASDPEYVEPPRAYASRVVRTMTTNLRVIANRCRIPRQADVPVLESYRKLTSPAEKYRVDVKIHSGNHSVTINRKFREILDKIVGGDEHSYGSISGTIEGINIHERNRRFWLYPVVGPQRVMGTFRAKDRRRFAETVDRYVTVYGRLSYKSWDKYAYAIFADDVVVHEPNENGLEALRGINPEATGHLNSRDFIDQIRDEW